jgi:hypothetical protein
VSSDPGDSQLLEVAPESATARLVPSLNVAVTDSALVVPTVPEYVLAVNGFVKLNLVTVVCDVETVIVIGDEVTPPNVPAMFVEPAAMGTRPRLIMPTVGADENVPTLGMLDVYVTAW